MPVILLGSGRSISWEEYTGQTAEEVKRLREELHKVKQSAWREVERITRARHLAELVKARALLSRRRDLERFAAEILEALK